MTTGFGLGFLPPRVRLLTVILVTSAFVWIEDRQLAVAAIVFSLIILFLNGSRNYIPLLYVISVTVLSYFLGNLLFSPEQPGSAEWWVFRINRVGLERGIIGGFKRGAMVTFSLAWLTCTSLPQMYESISFIRPIERWSVLFLRHLQALKREFILCRQSLFLRDSRRHFANLPAKVTRMRLILQALLLRTFMNVSKTAFAAETHWHGEETEDGSINVSELSVRYQPNDSDVLREVDLKISNGEFIYVGGLNGAGKTTLLRVLAGYIPRIAGEYRGTLNVCGRNLENLSLRDISKQIRFVPSDPLASIIGLTVGQEMAMLSITEGEAKACLEAMRVAHLWSRESTTLSGGEQVRLVLAGVLASDVKVLLLDAPLEQLDPNGRREFLEALETLRARSKKTIVITDPFFEDLRRNIDRFVLIENGRITENLDIDKVDDRILSRAGLKKESFTLELASVQSNQVAAKLDKVEVVLDGNPILRGVTLEIAPAECAVVMGPNGSGKTTAMLTLAGAITPTSGSVMSAGRVGYVYQDSALQLVEITTRAELALGPRLIKWSESRIDKFVEEGLQWSGLSGDELSIDLTPSKTRLLTIPAMNVDVQVMILDEPTLALDEVNVRKVVGFVESLLRVGVAVFIITHDQSLAKIASRIIEVDAGRIVRESVIVAY